MNADTYLEKLKERYKMFYDVQSPYNCNSEKFEIMASFNSETSKYVLSKKFKIYSLENNEHCFVKLFDDCFSITKVKNFAEQLKSQISIHIKPHPDHMKTLLTGIIVLNNPVDSRLIDFCRKYKYVKPFSFYFKGWCEIRLVLVDLENLQVYVNKKHREVVDFYNPRSFTD